MNQNVKLSVSPHIHSGSTTAKIMLDVLIALTPASIAGIIIFGLRALLVIATCVISCVLFEFLFTLIRKQEHTVNNLSAAVTGLLLALNLPANVPLWQCVIGSAFAIVVVKCLFGGLGCNLVNPAITARIFMLVAFGSMAKSAFPVVDAVSTATPLSGGDIPSTVDLLIGNYGGAIGETCTIALVAGGIYLLVRRVITWHLPVILIGTVFVLSLFMESMDVVTALGLTLSGGLFLGAIFMATDYVTSPATGWGKAIFAVGAGVLTWLIRYFGNYPEGVSFAILFMNILTPYIDRWTIRKIFGKGGNVK